LFPWFVFKWLLAVSKNKVCIKGTKISGYWRQKIKKMALRAIPEQEFSKVSLSGSIVGPSTQFLKGSISTLTPLSKL
jgi:hypothetical protein